MSIRTGRGRRGFSIKTFMADGTADGLRLIEHSQWVGKGVVVPRGRIEQHADRPELNGTGVFVLVGTSPATGCERVFIGQMSAFQERFQALMAKDFWHTLIGFIADGGRMHRAHAGFIEAQLIQWASAYKAAELDNESVPDLPNLNEPDQADAEYFCDEASAMAAMIGIRAFELPPVVEDDAEPLRLNGKGANATAFVANGRVLVTEGSTATRQDDKSCPGWVLDFRTSLVERGVLEEDGKLYRFTLDYAFDSASVAAMLMLAEESGPDAWKPAGGEIAGSVERKPTAVKVPAPGEAEAVAS